MALFSDQQRTFAEAIGELSYVNPFTAERVALEQRALGDAFKPAFARWSADADRASNNPNLKALEHDARQLAEQLAPRVNAGEGAPDERRVYRALARFALYADYGERLFQELIVGDGDGDVAWWEAYEADHLRLIDAGGPRSTAAERGHLLALFFQLRRAFHHIFTELLGPSMPAATLRAEVWHSIFTHDMRRYRRALAGRMQRVPTLVLGPSGTGKELIARAIGQSLYIPWSGTERGFRLERAVFAPVNLSALSATLIESELFGHKKGSFTGAIADKAGWLEACSDGGAVFLDEIGELDEAVQVKLLRVLEGRTYSRIGETGERAFNGKVVAATNRDLGEAMEEGRFRGDLYYRLCADVIVSPSLAERIDSEATELDTLVAFLARRLVGDDEAEAATHEVMAYVRAHLRGHRWPGNVRELEQCVRNVIIRGRYEPQNASLSAGAAQGLGAIFHEGALSADDLVRRYCTEVYARCGSYEETARRLKLDRRTVKSRIDPELLERLRAEGVGG
jgi:DNA-binding NtrC family response regulator